MRKISIMLLTVIMYTFSYAQGVLVPSQKAVQVPSDSICISSMVKVEIDFAMKLEKSGKTLYNYENNTDVISAKNLEKTENFISTTLAEKSPITETPLFMKSLLLAGAAFTFFSFVFFKRWREKRKKPFEKLLKERIGKMRTENFISQPNPVINDIRMNLLKTDSLGSGSISSKARELQISQGELMLAAKIKSYQLAQAAHNNDKVL